MSTSKAETMNLSTTSPLGQLYMDSAQNVTDSYFNRTDNASSDTTQGKCYKVIIPNELFLMIGLLSLVENILVIIAIIRNRNLHSPMYYFICCLALSDMLVSASNVAETLVMVMMDHSILGVSPNILHQMDNVLDMMICSSLVSSLAFLGAIAADRYITIFYALRYHSIMTTRRAVIVITGIWVASIISSTVFITFSHSIVVIICLISYFIIMLFIMGVLYLYMFRMAYIHAKQITTLQRKRSMHQVTSMKGAITLTILLGVFIICWGPFFLHLTLIVTCPKNPFCTCFFSHFNLFLILIMCNSLIDPVIYAFRSQELWKTLKEMVLCSCW
ncbi:melanocyte-stimulating hormone receptor [Protopterus annectens]|uniref:melanocyte-stimulating hormone receptor n=1 Tax=Protopterus annectens TaxID=7888 RepID=UPI001CF9DEA0|nr:melanocyte-stimulating hormone receptor [Protopterus annectens]